MKITVRRGDITEEPVDAIVNPSNSHGIMGGGVAWVIKKKGRQEIEDEAVKQAPIPVGSAALTTGGSLRAKHVIHATTMTEPAQRIGVENVKKATVAALECAARNGLKSIAFPGMGTGVGGVDPGEAAEAMVEVIRNFSDSTIEEVLLIGYEEEMYKAFAGAVKNITGIISIGGDAVTSKKKAQRGEL
jgi:O-acetyl-ADP-ribose deacetylase (regulator of RNase III)